MQNFLLPTRVLTPREAVIYNKAADDWARLTASQRTAAYAYLLEANLVDALEVIYLQSLTRYYERLDGIQDPRIQQKLERFGSTLRQIQSESGWELLTDTKDKLHDIVREPYPQGVPQQNFWHRVLGRAA